MTNRLPKPPFDVDQIPAAHRFEPQEMVDWLAPRELVSTGIQVLLSGLFGSYSDKREMQAALERTSEPDGDYSGQQEIWFDYVADLGDGFHATYAMAWLLAKDRLRPGLAPGMQEPEGWDNGLPRGRFLIMGGDQVYPSASASEYQNRLIGPYGAALPYRRKDWPHLYAIPGNHDWYDGLTSFLRIFCQRPTREDSALEARWIGAWEPRQRRSYFAIKLPSNWWLWGTDIQLSSDIDRPQLEYFFEEIVPQMQQEQEKTGIAPRVILVTATPSWIFRGAEPTPEPGDEEDEGEQPVGVRRSVVDPKAFDSLAHFEGLIRESGARVALVLSGDLHHFCHYVQRKKDERGHRAHRITSGGGGAYLFPTHQMPREIALPERGHAKPDGQAQEEREVRYHLRNTTFPSEQDSRRLGRGVWLLPFRNWRFSALLGGIYALFGWASPNVTGVLLGLLILLGTYELANSQTSFRRGLQRVLGVLHGGAHILVAQAISAGVLLLVDGLDLPRSNRFLKAIFYALPYAATMLVIGGLVGSLLFTLYLLASSQFTGAHTNEVFSSQKIPDYKSFIRLRIDANGDLTLYPIGVEKVPRAWKANPDAKSPEGEASWWNPAKGEVESRLIEGPVKIA